MTWNRTATLAALPVAAVAVIAGVVSYSHIEALGLATGQSITDARLLPLAVDGLIAAVSVILLAGVLVRVDRRGRDAVRQRDVRSAGMLPGWTRLLRQQACGHILPLADRGATKWPIRSRML